MSDNLTALIPTKDDMTVHRQHRHSTEMSRTLSTLKPTVLVAFRPLTRTLRFLKTQLPPVNFITLHYAYFISTCIISAIIFWGSSTPAKSVRFIDSLFLCTSAMTLAGLNTVNLSTLNTFQQFMLFLLIMLGSAIFISAFTVEYRRRVFLKRFRSILKEPATSEGQDHEPKHDWPTHEGHGPEKPDYGKDMHAQLPITVESPTPVDSVDRPLSFVKVHDARSIESGHPGTEATERSPSQKGKRAQLTLHVDENAHSRVSFSPDTRFRNSVHEDGNDGLRVKHRRSLISMTGVGAESDAGLGPTWSHPSLHEASHDMARQPTTKYFPSDGGYIARNSSFHNLTSDERETLGGVEYRALRWLSWIVPAYYVLWQLLGAVGIAAYVAYNRPDTARQNGLNPWWVGAFNAVSAFNNSGMSLLDANMTAFQTAYYMIITMGLLILAGNTCYPIFLRLIIWTIHRYMPKTERWLVHSTTLQFLLDHPRRCYTNMFPSRHTWWLLMAVITLNGIDWAGFEILNIGNKALKLSTEVRVIDGLFQAFAVRSGGFYIVPIPTLRISLQVLYVIMMYISVYPVVITMRNSNVYEERSLGIYSKDTDISETSTLNEQCSPDGPRASVFTRARRHMTGVSDTKSYFIRTQIRAQLAHDIWVVILAVFVIMIIEGSQFERDPAVFSVFNVIFEVVSGYGTVGISVGVPTAAYSFCGEWHTLSKIVLCIVMIRGRHRGLPVAIDKAVILPGERDIAGLAEEEDALIRAERTRSRRSAEGDLS